MECQPQRSGPLAQPDCLSNKGRLAGAGFLPRTPQASKCLEYQDAMNSVRCFVSGGKTQEQAASLGALCPWMGPRASGLQ